MKIIAIGDNVVDLYLDEEIMYPGGNALNVAVFCNRFSNDSCSYIGIVGNDIEGQLIEESLEKENINISRIRRAIGETGVSKVALDESGDRVFVGWNKGGVQSELKIQFTEEDLSFIHSHSLLHTSVYSHLEGDIPELCRKISVSFDFSTYKEEERIKKVCPYLEYAFFSGSDMSKKDCHELIKKCHALGTKYVGITRGKDGAVFSDSFHIYEQSSVETEVVDTLGAGDTFIAMLLTSIHQSNNIRISLQLAAEAAAETCGYYGAFGYGMNKIT